MEKMRVLVGVHYQLYNNKVNYLMIFRTSWTFFDLNPNEIYDKTTSILQFILLTLSS